MAQKQSYYELLKHPKWQKKRLEVLQFADFQCEDCRADDVTLHIHHTYYEKGLAPWEYLEESLHALCEECHRKAQDRQTLLQRQIGSLMLEDLDRLLGYVMALHANTGPMVPLDVFSYEIAEGLGDGFGLTAEEVIEGLEEGQIDGYKLAALAGTKRGRRRWVCGICGVAADDLRMREQTVGLGLGDRTFLQNHACEVHQVTEDEIRASQRRGDDYVLPDGRVWMRLAVHS
jgi:hypothetical protein